MTRKPPTIALPNEWPKRIRSAVLHTISLARLAFVAARGQAGCSRNAQARLRAELEAARGEITLLERELEIKDLRMSRVHPRERPHYRPSERLAILEIRAARDGHGAKRQSGSCSSQRPCRPGCAEPMNAVRTLSSKPPSP